MKKSKIIILLITLSFPVILYLFLRSYGHNEFALPVFFEQSSGKILCNDSTIDASSFKFYDVNAIDSLSLNELYKVDYKVIHFPNEQDTVIKSLENELNRVVHTFDELSLSILSFIPLLSPHDSLTEYHAFLSVDKSITYLYDPKEKETLVNCVYAFPTNDWNGNHPSEENIPIDKTLVLLDQDNRIRGYYDGYDTKDVDRLILEIRVLLSKK